ncbi:hypothetical protein GLOTRDRAFT_128915 [Gloeophyllum trabeum ATCC 11539]|uniref:DUF4470 domain-containing protein n=1 Tax=Gloeophyllum trabeum (strain ATCC 11539 / FP-39264 / Madison 617) TaxID=670483 RepID=S7Q847_GLOTA|nr:uncharacterized protein GLOTRDRAFT_128915 [Gloeophyllum trabeum ATCC 11539]EPQ55702.1 hypothetical protein GLOTRDRAFT_128915 [Gloeophyllum trabeum ATCC 11539]
MDLPIFKKCPDPTLEYYKSLLEGWDKHSNGRIDLQPKPSLSFLFGGVGDARHAYGTFIDIHRQFRKLDPSKKADVRIHLTLLDIHPAVLARGLLILSLPHKLTDEGLHKTERLEIRATVFHAFCGYVMPGPCHDM